MTQTQKIQELFLSALKKHEESSKDLLFIWQTLEDEDTNFGEGYTLNESFCDINYKIHLWKNEFEKSLTNKSK